MNNLREKWMHRLLTARCLTPPPKRTFFRPSDPTQLERTPSEPTHTDTHRFDTSHRKTHGTALQYTAVHGTEAMLITLQSKTNNQANRVPNLDYPSAATDEAHEQRVQACRRAPPDGTKQHREVYIRRNKQNHDHAGGRSVKVGVSDEGDNRVGDERLTGETRGGFDNTSLCAPSAQLTY